MLIPLRPDFDVAAFRLWAKCRKDGAQARLLLAVAAIYDGAATRGPKPRPSAASRFKWCGTEC